MSYDPVTKKLNSHRLSKSDVNKLGLWPNLLTSLLRYIYVESGDDSIFAPVSTRVADPSLTSVTSLSVTVCVSHSQLAGSLANPQINCIVYTVL